jgi:hypothetical protein
MSHTQWLQSNAAHSGRTSFACIQEMATGPETSKMHICNGVGSHANLKPNKSVSFARVENILSKYMFQTFNLMCIIYIILNLSASRNCFSIVRGSGIVSVNVTENDLFILSVT